MWNLLTEKTLFRLLWHWLKGETLAAVQFNYFFVVKLLFLTAELTFALSTSLTIQLSLTLLCSDMMGDLFPGIFSTVMLGLFPQRTQKWHVPSSQSALQPIWFSCSQWHGDQYLNTGCSNGCVFVYLLTSVGWPITVVEGVLEEWRRPAAWVCPGLPGSVDI